MQVMRFLGFALAFQCSFDFCLSWNGSSVPLRLLETKLLLRLVHVDKGDFDENWMLCVLIYSFDNALRTGSIIHQGILVIFKTTKNKPTPTSCVTWRMLDMLC